MLRASLLQGVRQTLRWSFAGGTLLALTAAGCGSSKDNAPACVVGDERCACYGNGTCNPGLACYSKMCVRADVDAAFGGEAGVSVNVDVDGALVVPPEGGVWPVDGSVPVVPSLPGDTGVPWIGLDGAVIGNDTGGLGPWLVPDAMTTETGGSTPSDGNLLTNGDFSQGEKDWLLTEPPQSYLPHVPTPGAFCETVASGYGITLGWPADASRALTLVPGAQYEFSYDAYVGGDVPISLQAKVGAAIPPYTPHFSSDDVISKTAARYSHTFVAAASSFRAGVAFVYLANWVYPHKPTGTLCIDNVRLSMIAAPEATDAGD